MLVQSINKAREAAVMVEQTKTAIRDVSGIRSFPGVRMGWQQSGHSDPIFAAVQLRDKLMKKLEQQQKYAEVCYEKMISALEQIPDPVTRKLFYDRHYLKYSWEQIAADAKMGTSAAKMRHKRYLEQEASKNAS